MVGPPKGGSATALSGTVFRVSERAAVVGPPKGGSATALSGTVVRVSEMSQWLVLRKWAQPLRSLAQGSGCQRGQQWLFLRKGGSTTELSDTRPV